MVRTQIFSYGGGIQTAAISVLILRGILPRPDHIVIADTDREVQSTWDYLAEVAGPGLAVAGLTVEVAPHSLAKVDLYSNKDDLLLPVYTATGKLPTFCSTEWKERVIMRWARNQGVESCDCWLGFSMDEKTRAKPGRRKWFRRTFPLLDQSLTRGDCEAIIEAYGWPLPHKSACHMCPNRSDGEWVQMRDAYPDQFQAAVELENEIREWDEDVWLHRSRVPLNEVAFDPDAAQREQGYNQCGMGYCWV